MLESQIQNWNNHNSNQADASRSTSDHIILCALAIKRLEPRQRHYMRLAGEHDDGNLALIIFLRVLSSDPVRLRPLPLNAQLW